VGTVGRKSRRAEDVDPLTDSPRRIWAATRDRNVGIILAKLGSHSITLWPNHTQGAAQTRRDSLKMFAIPRGAPRFSPYRSSIAIHCLLRPPRHHTNYNFHGAELKFEL